MFFDIKCAFAVTKFSVHLANRQPDVESVPMFLIALMQNGFICTVIESTTQISKIELFRSYFHWKFLPNKMKRYRSENFHYILKWGDVFHFITNNSTQRIDILITYLAYTIFFIKKTWEFHKLTIFGKEFDGRFKRIKWKLSNGKKNAAKIPS